MVLEKINEVNDIKNFNSEELETLAEEIREFLIEKISITGGHLAPNLGGCCKSLALVISTVIAPLLIYKVLTVCRIHLIDIRDGIREVMIPHPTVALAACQQTCHHSYQTK